MDGSEYTLIGRSNLCPLQGKGKKNGVENKAREGE
jgi:hypothetical protein